MRDKFLQGYVDCALWSSNDESTPEGGEPFDKNYGREDIAEPTLGRMSSDCQEFQEQNAADIEAYTSIRSFNPRSEGTIEEYIGHDFWLSRNGHGTGFFDRDAGDVGDRLQAAAKKMGEVYLYVGDDGLIYQN